MGDSKNAGREEEPAPKKAAPKKARSRAKQAATWKDNEQVQYLLKYRGHTVNEEGGQ